MTRIAFLTRSHNEDPDVVLACLARLNVALAERPSWEAALLAVDDGSDRPMGAIELARSLPRADCVLVRHPVQLGPGAALETALECARRLVPALDVVATFDPDGQHDPEELCRLVEHLLASGVDVRRERVVVMGSRFLGSAPNMAPSRRWVLRIARWLVWLFSGYRLTDAHNGLRVFTRPVLETLRLRSSGFSYASELLQCLGRMGAEVEERPVTIRYTPYSRGKGQTNWNALAILGDMVLRKLVP